MVSRELAVAKAALEDQPLPRQFPPDMRNAAGTYRDELIALAESVVERAHALIKDNPHPINSYRVQIGKQLTFEQLAAAVHDLHQYGYTTLYLSPVGNPLPGSTHGYNQAEPAKMHEEAGGDAGYAKLKQACREHGMGIILDVVPNHVAASAANNPWWRDVLENGKLSSCASYFDIDWNPLDHTLENQLLLPILGDHVGIELGGGQMAVRYNAEEGRRCFELTIYRNERGEPCHVLPLSVESYGSILESIAGRVRELQAQGLVDRSGREFQSICKAIRKLRDATGEALKSAHPDPHAIEEILEERGNIKDRISRVMEEKPVLQELILEAVTSRNCIYPLQTALRTPCLEAAAGAIRPLIDSGQIPPSAADRFMEACRKFHELREALIPTAQEMNATESSLMKPAEFERLCALAKDCNDAIGSALGEHPMLRILFDDARASDAKNAVLRECFKRQTSWMGDLMREQNYLVADWHVAAEEINYRRFFDVNELAGIRPEDPGVRDMVLRILRRETAEEARELPEQKLVTIGSRYDHIDGLRYPAEFLEAAAAVQVLAVCEGVYRRMGEERGAAGLPPFEELEELLRHALVSPPTEQDSLAQPLQEMRASFYRVVEKILAGPGETLPSNWPVNGTTGYELVKRVNRLWVDQESRQALEETYCGFTGRTPASLDFAELEHDTKMMIMEEGMPNAIKLLAGNLHQLERAPGRDCETMRQFTMRSLTPALKHFIAAMDRYRFYAPRSGPLPSATRTLIEETAARAVARAQRLGEQPGGNEHPDVRVIEWLRDILLSDNKDDRQFLLTLQQYTGATMAKAVEDTAFYQYPVLLSLNEVGGDPGAFGASAADFHAEMNASAAGGDTSLWPNATHDSKRGELVRLRIAALSELAPEWHELLSSMTPMLDAHRISIAQGNGSQVLAPSRDEIYFLLQTLIGCWPGSAQEARSEGFKQRIQQYMDKVIKEAKVNTRWTQQNVAWQDAMSSYVAKLLADPRFVSQEAAQAPTEFEQFERRAATFGMINCLAERTLRGLCASVHDTYQGTEGEHLQLVDPDNRGVPSFKEIAELNYALEFSESMHHTQLEFVEALKAKKDFSIVARYLEHQKLEFRKRHPDLLRSKQYEALEVSGDHQAVAVSRSSGADIGIVVAPRLSGKLFEEQMAGGRPWDGQWLILPAQAGGRTFRDVYTGRLLTPQPIRHADGRDSGAIGFPLEQLYAVLPVAMLEAVEPAAPI